jgi:hypothetical protein
MNTEELERTLAIALHASDDVDVDLERGLRQLAVRQQVRKTQTRRWTMAAVAASVAAALMVTGLVLGALGDDRHRRGTPVAPPISFSPSGLPVGLLEARVPRSHGDPHPAGGGEVATVRLRVRPDDSGTWSPIAGYDDGGAIAYPVRWSSLGPGRAVMSYTSPVCSDPRALVLTFRVTGRVLVVDDATVSGCLVPALLADDLRGTRFRIRPDPAELVGGLRRPGSQGSSGAQ